uniref:Uncharacterized protein n=1 Tax=Callorhinchus milii TaxID=7868 RepID=A0A4W3I6W8_CALMI
MLFYRVSLIIVGGVLDALTKVLVALYEEPEKAAGPEVTDVETLRLEQCSTNSFFSKGLLPQESNPRID